MEKGKETAGKGEPRRVGGGMGGVGARVPEGLAAERCPGAARDLLCPFWPMPKPMGDSAEHLRPRSY